MDRTSFRQDLEIALKYLRDVVQLRMMDLAGLLVPGVARDQRGWELSRYLLQQINRLRPLEGDGDAWVRCRYDLLTLRYVNGLAPDEVSVRLSMSRRHFYRQLSRAIDEFADFLWAGLSNEARAAYGEQPGPEHAPPDEGERLALLQRELLPLSSGEQSCVLSDVLDNVLELLSPIIRERQLLLQNEVPAGFPPIGLPPEILKQFLVSLLGHLAACRTICELVLRAYQQRDGVVMSVAWRANQDMAAISADTLADPGSRAGVALAILQGVSVETREDGPCAATYQITLPLVAGRNVLVVDDNAEVCLLLERYLKSANYCPLIAMRAADAIQLARSNRICAITLDLMMKDQDGWDILQSLRNDPQTAHLPIIVISVLDQEELALMLGATAFLRKPIMRNALIRALDNLTPLV